MTDVDFLSHLLHTRINEETLNSVLAGQLPSLLSRPGFHHIITLNPEIVVAAKDSPRLRKIVEKAAIILADGYGIVWPTQMIKKRRIPRVTGYDLTMALFRKSPFKIYLLGGTQHAIEDAVSALSKTSADRNLIGFHHGYLGSGDEASVIQDIKQKAPDIVLVGMGFPKQDMLIHTLSQHLTHGVGIGVGGVIDAIAGKKSLAPNWIRRSGFEWLYQGLRTPSRLRRWRFILPYLFCLFRVNTSKR